MENLIAFCWVIQDVRTGVEPTIYLQRPNFEVYTQKVFMFFNVFEAKKFIKTDIRNDGKIKISGNKKPSNVIPLKRKTIIQNGCG